MTTKKSDIEILVHGQPSVTYASEPASSPNFDPNKHQRIGEVIGEGRAQGHSGVWENKQEAAALRAKREREWQGNTVYPPNGSSPQSDPRNWERVGAISGQTQQHNGGV